MAESHKKIHMDNTPESEILWDLVISRVSRPALLLYLTGESRRSQKKGSVPDAFPVPHFQPSVPATPLPGAVRSTTGKAPRLAPLFPLSSDCRIDRHFPHPTPSVPGSETASNHPPPARLARPLQHPPTLDLLVVDGQRRGRTEPDARDRTVLPGRTRRRAYHPDLRRPGMGEPLRRIPQSPLDATDAVCRDRSRAARNGHGYNARVRLVFRRPDGQRRGRQRPTGPEKDRGQGRRDGFRPLRPRLASGPDGLPGAGAAFRSEKENQ